MLDRTMTIAPAPQTLEEAIRRAKALCSRSDLEELRGASDLDLATRFHFTLGYALRAELGLWGDVPGSVLKELSEASGRVAAEADSTSQALLVLLRQKLRESGNAV